MQLSDFDYQLPETLIAAEPAVPRDHSRLMAIDRASGTPRHRRFFELGDCLKKGDLLVLNNTKVFPARLFGSEAGGRKYEIFLLKPLGGGRWACLARPGKKVKGKARLTFPGGVVGIVERAASDFIVEFPDLAGNAFFDWLYTAGSPPLPPYIKREATAVDRESYQTVFAKETGSIAAPTAGLHFTHELLDGLRAKGVETAEVTLHVGYGTFAPVHVEKLDEHVMHEEIFHVPDATFEKLRAAKAERRRIIAVGTTALRALESIPTHGLSGETRLFIYPGYEFQWIDGLITNFHLPQSTLYILVSAFLGLDKTRACYEEAIREQYRFYSYGDAMAIL